jgi:hypothetical protein
MNFLLFGRGVAGVGGAGIIVCVFTAVAQARTSQFPMIVCELTTSQVAPLRKRPVLLGALGASMGLSSVIGKPSSLPFLKLLPYNIRAPCRRSADYCVLEMVFLYRSFIVLAAYYSVTNSFVSLEPSQ